MAPKIVCNPQKLAAIQNYFQASRVAHNIKDLEKHLPSVASINGMQVKDYLQALSDESKLTVEKIGSGNWYWSFASEAKKSTERDLAAAQSAHAKALAVAEDLRAKAESARSQREKDEDDVSTGGESREALTERKAALEKEVAGLEKALQGYEGVDPTVVEGKRKEVVALKAEVEVCTDDICAMEGWFRGMGVEGEELRELLRPIYEGAGEWDEEAGGLREVPAMA